MVTTRPACLWRLSIKLWRRRRAASDGERPGPTPTRFAYGPAPAAYQHGLALAMRLVVRARPTGFERADAINIRIPIMEHTGLMAEGA